MFRWAALILAIVLILALVGAILSSQKTIEPSQQQTAEKNHEKDGPKKSEIALFDRVFPDSTAVFNLFLVIFTGLLALVGFIQLSALNRAETIAANTAQAAKDAAHIAQKTLEASLRPFIFVKTLEVQNSPMSSRFLRNMKTVEIPPPATCAPT